MLLAASGFLSLLSYSSQDHLPKDAKADSGLGHPTPIINQENIPQTCLPTGQMTEEALSQSNDSSLYQVDQNLIGRIPFETGALLPTLLSTPSCLEYPCLYIHLQCYDMDRLREYSDTTSIRVLMGVFLFSMLMFSLLDYRLLNPR